MKIQLGEIVMNKTKKYLTPCLQAYGKEFGEKISTVWKVAIGIGDIVTLKSNIIFEKHIFILCEVSKDKESFNRFMDWISSQEMYEEDYAFDDIKKGCLHMLVIKLPEKCYHVYETFKESRYSKMYSQDELKEFFAETSIIRKSLIRDHEYKLSFSETLRKEYNVIIDPKDMDDDFELDFPLITHEEVFNTHLN